MIYIDQAVKNAGVVLAIALPTIPIHAFFGTLIVAWSALALVVAAAGLRAPGRVVPPVGVATTAAIRGQRA